ncbi:hypothetical protein [Enterobacter kobei]|uniref:hypothetical protein n=1 Tax=Enterobacter kobei TaxID=208224 RepID=UPI003CE75920
MMLHAKCSIRPQQHCAAPDAGAGKNQRPDNGHGPITFLAERWLEMTIAGIERWTKILSAIAMFTNTGFTLTILMAIQQIQELVIH